jgi:LysM repeat protein
VAVALILTSRRWIGAALVSSLAVLVGCSGSGNDDGSSAGSASTQASNATSPIAASSTVVVSSLPTVTYTVAAGDYLVAIASATGVSVDDIVSANGWADGVDHLIRPGDVIRLPSGATAGRPAPSSRPAGSGGDETDGYVEVESKAYLGWGPDGTTTIEDPLKDGTYYASSYSLTPDGSGIVFELARFITTEACLDALPTVPTGTVDESGCYGGSFDTSRTARVTLPVDGPVPVVLVAECDCTGSGLVTYWQVSSREFGRLLRGEPPSAAAPAGFQFRPFQAVVKIRGGSIERVEQWYSS